MGKRRIQRLVELMVERSVDYVAVMPGANLLYLTSASFHLSERPTLAFFPAQGKPAVIVPSFEATRFTSSSTDIDWRVFPWSDEEGPTVAFASAARALGLAGKTLAIEELAMRVRELRLIESGTPDVHLTDAEPLLGSLRLRKDETEIARMRQAIAITEAALEAVLADIHVGITERMIANQLVQELRQKGAEGLAFNPAVASGPNSAVPHSTPGDRALGAGDLLLFDFGVTIGGYASDITRTIAVGDVDDELRRVYDVVKRANAAGRAAARPGIEIQEVDRATRKVIVDAGYGQYFTHRTGHGLGLDVHEPPFVCEGDATILGPGMTFTVEPGIYLPGKGGVRIEDDVVITPGGSESLTSFDRELKVL
jgi:Xaa-Pro dipeptidase